jgi:RNA polymerase sigma-70 factor (ECF subfamily)
MESSEDVTGPHELTVLIRAWQGGDLAARASLFALVYSRVRAIAAQSIRRQGGATLTPTELAHESLMRMLDADADWADRKHFFHLIAQATRQVLVDHARRRLSGKRGAGADVTSLDDLDALMPGDADALLVRVSDALESLAQSDVRRAQIIDMTYFGGFEREEIALALEVSVGTVDRDLRFARAWLKEELGT